MRVYTPPHYPVFLAVLFGPAMACCQRGLCTDVVIEPALTFQTIAGWGHGGGVLGGTANSAAMLPASLADPVNYQYLDFLTDDLGLTGSRTPEVGARIDGNRLG